MKNNNSEVVVELRNVTKRFGDFAAVDNISLQILQGEFFSLLGPSGCGKTTTLRMVAGFTHPSEGEIYIKSKLVNGVPAYERDTNLVFQQLALFPHLDVYDNVAFGLQAARKYSKEEIGNKVRSILEMVELGGLETRHIQQLSGGQQQRVAIARALVNEPAVLLLDEPLGALDLKLRLQMQIELKALQKRVGTTFIYVTHDQGEAITMSDRIAVINKGKIEQVATSNEIYSNPATKFVAQFIGDTNFLDGKIAGKEKDGVFVSVNGCNILVTEGNAIIPEGKPAHISLRPEKIKIIPVSEESKEDNVFEGTVKTITFMGAALRYVVILENGIELMIVTPNDTSMILNKGERIKVVWAKESCAVLGQE